MTGGFLDAIVLHGEARYGELTTPLQIYPEALVPTVIRSNMGFSAMEPRRLEYELSQCLWPPI